MPSFSRFRVWSILLIGLVGLSAGQARATEGGPADGVRNFYAALLDTMKNAKTLGVKGRYKKLEPVVLGVFDVPYMTKLAVGPLWSQLAPDQKQRAWTAFGRFITANYAAQFDGFSGEEFKITGDQKVPHGVLVKTALVKSDGEPIVLNYKVHDNDIGWQIRDVYLTGTISQIATRRSEFAALLKDGGIENLITVLNKKSDDLEG